MKNTFLILLLCCLFLFTTAYAESTISVRSIAKNGKVSDNIVDIAELSQSAPSSVLIEILPEAQICTGKDGKIIECPEGQASSQPKTITAQLYPGAALFVSPDLKNIMQISNNPKYPQLEIYYGYSQEDLEIPWYDYIRVENGFTVHGNFITRQVWIISTNSTKLQEIIDSGTIPVWSDLP